MRSDSDGCATSALVRALAWMAWRCLGAVADGLVRLGDRLNAIGYRLDGPAWRAGVPAVGAHRIDAESAAAVEAAV